ncbi:hypothetical protein OIE66_11310 [Nonomuraea sp. NBC_01738]|uniref:hypothetical protein n=1 Tax=Nonomuraea sp. NBC_01738 TaxID=2976003 RepID=UPI002E150EDE|nr:hypothetical protein OIE66_11310 [Nonomuraea sp. NBC_01738]
MDQYFDLLVTPDDHDPAGLVLELPPGTTAVEAARVLAALYDTDASADRVLLRIGGRDRGVSARLRVGALRAGPRGVGDADRATLAGRAAYTLVRFHCPSCTQRAVRVHVDEDDLPRCQDHGVMRIDA